MIKIFMECEGHEQYTDIYFSNIIYMTIINIFVLTMIYPGKLITQI